MFRVLFCMRRDYNYNELIEPELRSLAELYGIKLEDFRQSFHHKDDGLPLPVFNENGYYLRFSDYYRAVLNGECVEDKRIPRHLQNVFYYANVPSIDVAIAIFHRCIQIKSVIDVWTEGRSYNEILDKIKNNHEERIVSMLEGKSWCVKYQRYNAKTEQSELVGIINTLSEVLNRGGSVNLTKPNTKIAIIETYTNGERKELDCIYYGHYIRDRNDIGMWWEQYSLSKRPILAPTSLENTLAFIMANLGNIKKGSVVLDPFVGSGGSLVAASHFGGVCFGSDVDMRVLMGYGLGYHNRNLPPSDLPTNVFTNFKHYGLPLPEILRFDNLHTAWRAHSGKDGFAKEWVDAIITDPPYGIRATAKNRKGGFENGEDGILQALIEALLDIGETMLVPGGRLVFLLPTDKYRVDNALKIIKRERLEVRDIGRQQMHGEVSSRYIVVMSKV